MMMTRNGFVRFLQILKKKKQYRINMSSLYREWEAPLYIPKGKVRSNSFIYENAILHYHILINLDSDWDHYKEEKVGFVQH